VNALLKKGKPRHQKLYLDIGYDASDGRTFKRPAFWQHPKWKEALATFQAAGGIMITASHNPQPWNALKFLEGRGLFLTVSQNRDLATRLESDTAHVAADRLGRIETRSGADAAHIAGIRALPWLDPEAIRQRKLQVVVDAVEGAGGSVVPY